MSWVHENRSGSHQQKISGAHCSSLHWHHQPDLSRFAIGDNGPTYDGAGDIEVVSDLSL